MKDRLEELLAKYWVDQISAEEKAELERLMWEHPDDWIKSGLLQQIEGKLRPITSNRKADEVTARILQKEQQEQPSSQASRRKRHRYRMVAAFSFLILMGALGFWWLESPSSADQWQYIRTEDGMKTTLRLADGTRVWLNAGSSLRYPKKFGKGTRAVYLVGEAYFKVSHDADQPFIIHTAHMDAKVLGTEVNVRAYPNEAFSETSLIKGLVNVIIDGEKGDKEIRLQPRQKVKVENGGSNQLEKIASPQKDPISGTELDSIAHPIVQHVVLQPIKVVDSTLIAETAWKQNTFLFENEPLSVLAKRLDRWYGVQIHIRDSTLARQRFSGRADNVSLNKLLQILQMTQPFDYVIKDKKVIIE